MKQYEHGGDIYGRDILYDFSANLNPLGMPQGVREALTASMSEWEKYPDPFCRSLTEMLAERESCPAESIVCGNGAADLIYRIVRAVKPKKAAVCAPCFSEYEKALTENGCIVKRHYLDEKNGFAPDETILSDMDGTDMLILCTPGNPSGRTADRELMKKLCRVCEERNVIFLCDECFLGFVRNGAESSAKNFINKNVIVLNAFTKLYAMAGLRLGYAVFSSAALAAEVRDTGQYWSVSAPAQIAGKAALAEEHYVKRTVEIIEREREYLSAALSEQGFRVFPSEANFILFYADIPVDKLLLGEKILIRNCENYHGLGRGYFRTSVRSHEENSALISALKKVVK